MSAEELHPNCGIMPKICKYSCIPPIMPTLYHVSSFNRFFWKTLSYQSTTKVSVKCTCIKCFCRNQEEAETNDTSFRKQNKTGRWQNVNFEVTKIINISPKATNNHGHLNSFLGIIVQSQKSIHSKKEKIIYQLLHGEYKPSGITA